MSWQAETYQWLREADREWIASGVLFDEVRDQIPLHAAMRRVTALYGEDRVSGSKATWLYFTQVLKHIGVERQAKEHYWGYQDGVRLKHVAGLACRECGGPVIWGSWSGRSPKNTVCLACLKAEAKGQRPPMKPLPSPPPAPALVLPAPIPIPPAPIPISSDTVPPAPPAEVAVVPPRHAEKVELTELSELSTRQKIKGPLLVRLKEGYKVLAYRRTLARELKPVLNVSVNRLERELERSRDNLAHVLALHGKTVDQLPKLFMMRVQIRGAAEMAWRAIR